MGDCGSLDQVSTFSTNSDESEDEYLSQVVYSGNRKIAWSASFNYIRSRSSLHFEFLEKSSESLGNKVEV